MLLGDSGVAEVGALCAITEDQVRDCLRDVSSGKGGPQPLNSYLGLLADGRSCAQARRKLKLTRRALEALREDPATAKLDLRLGRALLTKSQQRETLRALTAHVPIGSGALGPGAQQVVPVRFPEAQHQRLKDWCATHGFPMAVVVRGLVERFLDDQERCAT